MDKIRFFQRSLLGTECDACGGRVDLMQGGACERCRRILCFRHLYGSWLARLRSELGGGALRCVECRAGRTPSLPTPGRETAGSPGA
jgi:hypothetical protein